MGSIRGSVCFWRMGKFGRGGLCTGLGCSEGFSQKLFIERIMERGKTSSCRWLKGSMAVNGNYVSCQMELGESVKESVNVFYGSRWNEGCKSFSRWKLYEIAVAKLLLDMGSNETCNYHQWGGVHQNGIIIVGNQIISHLHSDKLQTIFMVFPL